MVYERGRLRRLKSHAEHARGRGRLPPSVGWLSLPRPGVASCDRATRSGVGTRQHFPVRVLTNGNSVGVWVLAPVDSFGLKMLTFVNKDVEVCLPIG